MSGAPGAKVLVLYTGGTIGMVPRNAADPASPLVPAAKERLVGFVPNPLAPGIAWELRGLRDAAGREVEPLDSSNVGPLHWGLMAQAIAESYGAYDGFVILHGTDTLAYTGSALAFLLHNLGKPVVLTGSQHPISHPHTDAIGNFTHALRVAGGSGPAEVVICFGGRVLRACRAVKVSTCAAQGFAEPNPHAPRLPQRANGPFRADIALSRRVTVLSLHPGMDEAMVEAVLGRAEIEGCILRCFGSGNVPDDVLEAIGRACAAGKVVVAISQCPEGTVELGRYAAGAGLERAGVISGGDMTAEAALTKLMWLLANAPRDRVPALMRTNLRGELT